jgi:15-cis-phytoene synthase
MSQLSLEASIHWCRAHTKRAATSFYYAFKTLPRRKRIGFEVVYAFMRHSDDLSDGDTLEPGPDLLERSALAIREWRDRLRRGLAGELDVHPCMPALVHVLEDFAIDPQHLFDLIDGTEQDMTKTRFASWDELRDYCYLVASTVGLVSIRLFGLRDESPAGWERAEKLAIVNGYAFQLTNILRDVAEDFERDRIYLPAEDLARFELREDQLQDPVGDPRFRELMAFECARAESLYGDSRELVSLVADDARASLRTMRRIYHGILESIVAQDYDVYSRRARVPLRRKLSIAATSWLGLGSEV